MSKISINLPTKKRLDITLVKRRNSSSAENIASSLQEILKIKKGSKFSRLFRKLFEKKKVKKVLGANLAFFAVVASFLPGNDTYESNIPFATTTKSPVVLETNVSLKNPVDEIKVSQGYSFYHAGVDYDGITGEPVYTIIDGVVDAVQYSNYAYGNAVYIVHGDGLSSLYAHLSQIYVAKDQTVSSGDQIGTIGATGRASGDHLHLEIRKNGVSVNPATILP